MATPEEFVEIICPSLVTVSGYATYISLAESLTSSGYFGENYAFAVALRASHLYVLNTKRSGESGYVTAKTEGRLSKSFGGLGNIQSELQMTSYGMQLLDLIRSTSPAVSMTSTDVYNTYLGGS